ncbi:3-phosphoshikimate 1-carboxyvinyltransferase [Pacificimonas flava]|uniref:3-phosphoshikimate 1-carboxyvinyltransferase n=2 Tax=Pacificimonas TaxID=1960290 RepID=A0A219B2P9_9SPHN|nr:MULTISPECIES: 3-phosphoshikimate 1-carboxyvinyltransferase [Pacificimonas]MBZ6378287.1 3-phosphoshikimate 1-carboxyvinyltransferase [Pacificimonas aurantium]OWV32099.1 3-phosphoshikimate 1-carboxyvinyltransferase [Pacificimonas flava]
MTDKRELALSAPGSLSGRIRVPGDKSISHRSLMFGALAVGRTQVTGLLTGEDVLATASALRAMGASIDIEDGSALIEGVGVGGLLQPQDVIDLGNSGTSARLLMGLLATHPLTVIMTGDASLRKRPMNRVIEPLSRFGAEFSGADGRLPLQVRGTDCPVPQRYELPVASAQVKSAVLLAGLNTPGRTTVVESVATRDHTERMLRCFGVDVDVEQNGDERIISVTGHAELSPARIDVPGDISSAAFPLVAALIVRGSSVVIEHVGLNPTRTGLLDALSLMGARVERSGNAEAEGEPAGGLTAQHSGLVGAVIPPDLAPLMIDEYPILMVAAAVADGVTEMRGLEELRVKESDRLAVMAEGLAACGVPVELLSDGIRITGSGGGPIPGGARIDAHLDHRIAMSFACLGLVAREPVLVDDASPIDTSFPGFVQLMRGLGCRAASA